MEESFDAIIVGGGLSGLAAAYTLAAAGKSALVIERGDYCGAKNVTGGRMYLPPIRGLFPEIWDKAPLERAIVHEELCMISATGSMLMRYSNEAVAKEPYESYTVLRANFDRFFAKRAERKGAQIITKAKVENLCFEGDRIKGVVVGGEKLYANVVIICDGALSLIAEKAGLRKPGNKKDFAVGIKELIELDEERVNERFNVVDGQGAARLFMGDITRGKFGGGFIYANKGSVSLGLVLGIADLMDLEPAVAAPDLLDAFKKRSEVASIIKGGQTVEYSAHVIPEGGYKKLSAFSGNGVLVCGDAAGLALNAGITVRGMEYAMASGYYAAQAVIKAAESNFFTAEGLKCYDRMLDESFIIKDHLTYKGTPHALENHRLYTYYPEFVTNLLGNLYSMPEGPKQRAVQSVKKAVTPGVIWNILRKDLGGLSKL
ncbi:MAG: FAD-dependent oxidoreductase [Coriobacteriia bacterium]|nr:FAD-dependent oxidoreductase [Coriobacteriia bacterium]MCL2749634.1 FAD-dependent oxidoreductase [Coriobacteriia bacterium]